MPHRQDCAFLQRGEYWLFPKCRSSGGSPRGLFKPSPQGEGCRVRSGHTARHRNCCAFESLPLAGKVSRRYAATDEVLDMRRTSGAAGGNHDTSTSSASLCSAPSPQGEGCRVQGGHTACHRNCCAFESLPLEGKVSRRYAATDEVLDMRRTSGAAGGNHDTFTSSASRCSAPSPQGEGTGAGRTHGAIPAPLPLKAFPLRGRCRCGTPRRMRCCWICGALPVPLEETMTLPPHPPRDARHLLLKEKAVGCGADVRCTTGGAGGSRGPFTSAASLRTRKKGPRNERFGDLPYVRGFRDYTMP